VTSSGARATTVGSVDVGGVEVCVADTGIGADAVLVLVHGAGGSHRQWSGVQAVLPRWIRSIAIDLPGHGLSGGVAPAGLSAASAVVIDVLDALEVHVPCVIAGHSLGGMVALGTALDHPHRIAGLGLIATAARIEIHPAFARMTATGVYDEAFVRGSFGVEASEEAVRLVLDDLRRLRLDGDALLGAGVEDLSPRLRELRIPTGVIAAGEDAVISPRRARRLAQAIDDASLTELRGSGHYVHVERPVEVAAAVVAVMAEVRNIASDP
jgi:pimeloyl-ACP methyl ester carboxylesterase